MVRKSKSFKGFTLIELIVVMAIIVIMAGIVSLFMNGFVRTNRIETNNAKAKVVYDAFQDILIDCEVKQDKSMFDVRQFNNNYGDITGAVMFFRIASSTYNSGTNQNKGVGLGDEIHIMTTYENNVPGPVGIPTCATGSIWKSGTTLNVSGYDGYNDYYTNKLGVKDGGAELWDKWDGLIEGMIDNSMEGSYCVMLDLTNYEVAEVITRELEQGTDPKMGLYDFGTPETKGAEYSLKAYMNMINNGTDLTTLDGRIVNFPMGTYFVKNVKQQENIAKGMKSDKSYGSNIYIGCYPYFDDVYSDGYSGGSNY